MPDSIPINVTVTSPAKVNLTLSVHGRRPDGFHELTSLMVPLEFGDTLTIHTSNSDKDVLRCSNPAVPLGSENLILKAAHAFRARSNQAAYFKFHLEKKIPMGGGLGGGSSNAVAALSGMNQLLDKPLSTEALHELSAQLGSDCPFFIDAKPAWIYGRGERIEPLNQDLSDQLKGVPLVLFKPNFSVNTAWAFGCLAANAAENYQPDPVDVVHLESSIRSGALDTLVCNAFEKPVGSKYLALPTLLHKLRTAGATCAMSGSGSSCFAIPDSKNFSSEQIKEVVLDAWGENVFWVETFIS